MKESTRTVIEALAEIRGRLQKNEGMNRFQIATAHRMARMPYRNYPCGREWTKSIVRNFLI